MQFPYALVHVDTGLIYTGESGPNWIAKPSLDHPPYTYTALGASRKIDRLYDLGHFFTMKRIY